MIGYGVKGDRIWGIAPERLYLKGKTLDQRPDGTPKVIRYGAIMNDPASLQKKTCIL